MTAQPCPCPPCLAARSLDLGYTREPCAYAATLPAPAPVLADAHPAFRRHVYRAFTASARIIDVAAIARATGWHERDVAALAHEWARNDVGCEECGATGVVHGQYDCADCDGWARAPGRQARVILDGAELECGFCAAEVEDGDTACMGCGVEFVADMAADVAAEEE